MIPNLTGPKEITDADTLRVVGTLLVTVRVVHEVVSLKRTAARFGRARDNLELLSGEVKSFITCWHGLASHAITQGITFAVKQRLTL